MADQTTDTGKPLTGRKVFAIFAGAFALIIGVNVFMAYSAVGTFPGLEVENSYVASQTFDADRVAQEALGWDVQATVEDDTVQLRFAGKDGAPVTVQGIDAFIGRTTERKDDQTLVFVQNALGSYVARIEPLDYGKWEIRFVATAADGTPFKQRIQIVLPES